MELKSFAWLALNESIDDEGFYLEDSPELREIERAELKAEGAPDTEHIVFVSILPESRDEAMVEAMVTDAFIEWAKGEGGLVWYDEE